MKKKTLNECKSLDDIEDNNLMSELFNSPEFQESMTKGIEDATWGKGRPMVYIDEEGWMVKHWKDGRIDRIKKLK